MASLLEYKYDEIQMCSDVLDSIEYESYTKLVSILNSNGNLNSVYNIDEVNNDLTSALDALSVGYSFLLNDTKQIEKTFELFKKALEISKEIDSTSLEKFSLLSIIYSYHYAIVQTNEEVDLYLEEYRKLSTNKIDEFHYLHNKIVFGLRNIENKINVQPTTVKKLEAIITKFPEDHAFWPNFYSTVGTYYEHIGELNKAQSYYEQSILTPPVPSFLKRINFRSYIRLAEVAKSQKKYQLSLQYVDSASNYLNLKDSLRSLYYIKSYKSNYQYLLQNYKMAFETLKESNDLSNKLLYEKNALEISNLNVKYQTAEKEKQNLLLTADKKRNQNIAIGLGGTLALGSVIGILLYRNTKRKQRIAEQETELEIQRTEKVLKEKEIETINAMVEGQEKERQRLAGELHDNLGSTLATVRMQVENLERNLDQVEDPKSLLTKTHQLINEAYDKVRRISHERNAGVLAKEGLLPAVERLARTVSASGSIEVDVQEYGLEKRLSNDLEITIFRIIQELTTNIVKHAKASQATISLTQHDNELNIMVEDNGQGFKAGKLIEKDGMGLGSIERRVEHLEGTMEVDSSPGNGTNIIIDIPLI